MAAGGPQTDPPGLVPQSTRPALHLLARHAQGPRVARAAHPHCRAVRYMNEHALLGSGMGMIIGAILALTGAGGGILAVPLLVFGLGLSIAQAAPVGLLAVGLAAAVGVLVYSSVRMFRKAAAHLRHGQPAPRAAMLPCVLNPLQGRLRWTLPCARALTVTGMLSGFLSGLLGVGGGFVIIPALTRYTDLDMKSVIATSLAVIALVSAGSVTTAALTGRMDWAIGAPFAAGAIAGLMVGRYIARFLNGPRLQQLFAAAGVIAALMLVLNALGFMY